MQGAGEEGVKDVKGWKYRFKVQRNIGTQSINMKSKKVSFCVSLSLCPFVPVH